MSGLGTDVEGRENVLVRHSNYIKKQKDKGLIPIGDVELNPKWSINYNELLADYLKGTNVQ
jgi:hypothetical protein